MTEKKESTKADAEEKKVAATKKEGQPSKETSTKRGQESKPTEAKKESQPAPKKESKPSDAKKESKPAPKKESKPSDAKKESKPAPKKETKPSDAKKESKPAPKKDDKKEGEETDDDVTIVEEGEEAEAPVHTPRIKPELDDETRVMLAKRREIDGRRPEFRRQQWFEYKRLSRTGWRKPTGQDSAMRRHFVYRPSVVRIGFRGPAAVRGLHPSGFEEVRVERPQDLEAIDPKKQAARVSGSVGKRKLKDIYKEADKRKIRVLNRRSF